MRPLDPRLLRYARSSRRFLTLGAVLTAIDTAAIIGFAWFVTNAITSALGGASPWHVVTSSAMAGAAALIRGAIVWLLEAVGTRGAARAKSELRLGILEAVDRLGPAWLAHENSTALATLLARGVDALDDYFAKYIPQLIRTAITVPVLIAVVLAQDWLSGVILVVTLPIVPIFMVLIGLATKAAQRRQWDGLTQLSVHFMDVISGLGTLKIFGRERRQIGRVREMTDDYRRRTMGVLRISFLSGFVLELMASLSVALIAVSIGFRLVDGALSLTVGLFVLLLAPDVYFPIRQVGAQFHAAAEGTEAAEKAFDILDAASAERPAVHELHPSGDLVLSDVAVERGENARIGPLSISFPRGTVTAITGSSGAGKSTLLDAIAGAATHTGTMSVGGTDVSNARMQDRNWLAWAPQTAYLVAGTVLDNVTLGSVSPDATLATHALRLAGAGDIELETRLDDAGEGLSGGQRQRVALARCFYRAVGQNVSVIAVDEPTSALDERSEEAVARGLRHLASRGASVIVVTHRTALLEWADRHVDIEEQLEVVT